MARNYNIQTRDVCLNQTATDTINIGPVVPTGMTRYVTFIRLNPLLSANDEGSLVYISCGAVASAGTTNTLASAGQKLVICAASASTAGNKSAAVPESPNTEHPLFTVAGGAYLYAHLSSIGTMSGSAELFVQYFDE